MRTFLCEGMGFVEQACYREGDRIVHCELRWPFGGGLMMASVKPVSEEWRLEPGSFGAYLGTDDVEGLFARTLAAGATATLAPHDTPYGSREAAVRDPEGNQWSFGTYTGAPVGE